MERQTIEGKVWIGTMAAMLMVVVAFVSFKIVFAATTITVNTLVDENGTGTACSLREAIITANTNLDTGGCVRSGTGEDIIEFDLGSRYAKHRDYGCTAHHYRSGHDQRQQRWRDASGT